MAGMAQRCTWVRQHKKAVQALYLAVEPCVLLGGG